MDTPTAVFVATLVVYLGATVLPFRVGQEYSAWLAQATTATCALATFFALRKYRASTPQALAVALSAAAVTALASTSLAGCMRAPGGASCNSMALVHASLLSGAALAGSASYVTYVLWLAIGLPVWAAVVATLLGTPLLVAASMPLVNSAVGSAFGKIAA